MENSAEENNLNLKKIITLYDLIKIFYDYKKIIFIITLVVGAITAIFMFFIIDPIYMSQTTVKTTSKQSGLENIVSQSVSGLGDIGEIGGSSSTIKELSLYENILTSRRCLEETIIKFKLNDDWEFKYMQDAVKNFRENCIEVVKDKMAGTIEINVYDKVPQRAKEIADFLIYQLNKINIELNVQKAKTNREFIEGRYNSLRDDLKKAEDTLRIYQEINGIVPDIRIKTIATSEIQLEMEVKSEEIKLELLKKTLSPEQPEVKIQEEKIAALKKQLGEILNSSDKASMLRLNNAPTVLINYARVLREVELQSKLLAFIMPLYEQAKIEEKKEMPSVLVIDQPSFPERKSKPKRINNILLSIALTFFLTYFILLVRRVLKNKISIAIKEANKDIL